MHPVRAALARIEGFRPRWPEDEFRHFVIAVGGGVLLDAVDLVPVPEGSERLTQPLATFAALLAGGFAFMAPDRFQAKRGRAAPQLTAMPAEFLPESLAPGGMFAAGADGAALLAPLIALQNLPEGFNAWRELVSGPFDQKTAQISIVLLAFVGPFFGAIGWFWLAGQDAVLGGGDAVCRRRHPPFHLPGHCATVEVGAALGPPLGAVLGFGLVLPAKIILP